MGVFERALLSQVENISSNPNATIGNVLSGGQLGLGPRLANIDAATPLVFPPTVAVVTHIPTMMKRVPYMPELLKAIIEQHAKTIDGVDFGYTLEEVDGYILNDGQTVKAPSVAKRTEIAPSITFPEYIGNPIWNMFKTWITMMVQPDTGYSKLSSMLATDDIDPMVFSAFSMDIILIQFDITMLPKNIIDAAFVTTMYPKVTGNLGLKREIGVSQTPERNIEFSGIVQHNTNTFRAGQIIAEMLGLHRANFDVSIPVATQVESEIEDFGLYNEIEEVVSTFDII